MTRRRRGAAPETAAAPAPAPARRGRAARAATPAAPGAPRRQLNFFVVLNIVISVLVGGMVLVGYLMPAMGGVLVRLFSSWTSTIIVFALLLGLFNVLRVHVGRILARRSGWPYSVALVLAAAAVPAVGFAGIGSIADPGVQWLFDWIYVPIGSSLFALMTFLVAAAAFRTLRAGPSAAWVVLGVAVLVILGSAAWLRDSSPLRLVVDVRDWVVNYPALAGLRGILIGSALGAIATSVRVLLGIDRPYVS